MLKSGNLPGAILFDLDDTLIASSETTRPAWPEICEMYQDHFSGQSAATVLAEIKSVSRWFWSDPDRHRRGRLDLSAAREEILATTFARLKIEPNGLLEKIASDYSRLRDEKTDLFPGVPETLAWFRRQNVRLALITNGDTLPQREKLARFNLEPFFDYILIEGEFGMGKPEPKVYLTVLEQLQTEPAQAWIVGDNYEWEVVVPKKLGLFTVWVDSRRRGLPAAVQIKPDRIVQNVSELVE